MAQDSIVVLGRKISYDIKDVDIYNIEFYPENPRINTIIRRNSPEKITQDFIEQELLKLDSTKDMVINLENNKGLLDEVYVVRNKVVEGNTRLCAFRRLSKKYPDDPKWRVIKARVIQDDITEEELFHILSTFHIIGKKAWDAYEKAAYIHKMIKELNKSPEEISKQLGIYKKTIDAMLQAYEAMSQKYLPKVLTTAGNGVRDELKKYSYFEAFYLQKDLVQKSKETPAFLDEFVEWVKEDRFKKAQNVRELPKILSNKKAAKSFYDADAETAFDDAIHILYEHKPEKVDRFYKRVREFRDLIKESEVFQIKEEIHGNKNKKAELQQCYRELKRFCKEVGLEI